jgi:hypothetical protein
MNITLGAKGKLSGVLFYRELFFPVLGMDI